MSEPSNQGKAKRKSAGEVDSSTGDPDTETRDENTGSTAASSSDAPWNLPDGHVLGQYQVEAKIDQGSFGVVYRAYQAKLDRHVALKIPKLSPGTDQGQIDRFLAEARTLAKMEHPGIVPVYDCGELDQGVPFVVMRLLDGATLESTIAQGATDWRQACHWGAAIADALASAHNMDVVHRDLKPANILLDGKGNPLVADFGLAIGYENQSEHENEIAGTYAYMSPEQIRGQAHWLDGRTDIWSLGVILYEMAGRRHPFRGKGSKRGKEILHRDPWPLRQIDPTIPVPFEAIVNRCLAKRCGDRFATADELANRLRVLAHSDQELSPAVEWTPPATSLPRRQAWPLVGIGVVCIAALAVWILATGTFRPGRPSDAGAGQTEVGGGSPSLSSAEDQRGASSSAGNESPTQQSTSLLDGTIDVLVWDPDDQTRRGLGIRDPGALPLRAGDQIRLNVQLNQPAFIYLLWIDSEGQAIPVYPWEPGDWTSRPRQEKKLQVLSLPETSNHGWPLTGAPGMETLVVLARDEPLAANIDLRNSFERLPLQPMQDARSIVWFRDGKMLSDKQDAVRGPSFFDEARIDDPLLETQRVLYDRLHEDFALFTAVSFAKQLE